MSIEPIPLHSYYIKSESEVLPDLTLVICGTCWAMIPEDRLTQHHEWHEGEV